MECYDFGLRIKQLRTSKGLTQEKLAAKLGLTKQSISGYESNTSYPPIDVLRRMSLIFGVSADYILGLDNRKSVLLDGLSQNQIGLINQLICEFRLSSGQ